MAIKINLLLQIYPKTQLVQKAINEFAKRLNCDGLIIIDDNSIIIGSFFENETSKVLLQETIQYFLTLNDCFHNLGKREEDDQILVQKLGYHFLFKTVSLKDSDVSYHFSIVKARNPYDLYFIKKELQLFMERLIDILNR